MQFIPPVSKNRIVSTFPKCYNPQACLQMKEDWSAEAKLAFKDRATRQHGSKMSKVVVVGDLNVGKTCLINRFCKDVFDRDYKATIGVDFEIVRFELSGLPFSLQIWDTAGQEKFKCIAAAYYRGAQVIVAVFDMTDIKTLEHTKQWLIEALNENEPNSCFIFLVGTKRDLMSPEECRRTERDAVKMAEEINAEFWSVSSKTGENVQQFFFRVAALAFEDSVVKGAELCSGTARIGDVIKVDHTSVRSEVKAERKSCC
ncbi:ras-related protein Rab-36 [Silurus meridionalis]|uniref:Ras-related protein Rab-36 n=1 Tax=Silurus meridionalis TaxID=175797 RepID=A0A8T0B5Z2_SILME|nr:ras-related protein Rab-36 [Silurus meridionalis]XP_046716342.1 ras-related protein Rab-36 [Silurus meridionalis]KAF7700823.1 hypothetical protein HF521_001988 [Silurus meridionalis]